jgi:hypothetical protein
MQTCEGDTACTKLIVCVARCGKGTDPDGGTFDAGDTDAGNTCADECNAAAGATPTAELNAIFDCLNTNCNTSASCGQ